MFLNVFKRIWTCAVRPYNAVDLDLATQGTEESIISTNAVFTLQASLNIVGQNYAQS